MAEAADNDNLEHLVIASDSYSVASSHGTSVSDTFESSYEDPPPRSHGVPVRARYTSTSGLEQDDADVDHYETILDPTLREYGHKMELEDRTLMMLHTEGFKTMDLARELTVEDVKAMQSKEHYRLVPIMQFKIITKAVQMRFYDPDFVPRLKDTGTQMEIPTDLGNTVKPENLVNRQCRVMILGKAGSGKSTLANKLLGRPNKRFTNPLNAVEEAAARKPEDPFFVGSNVSGTKTCQFGTNVQNGIELTVVDTPGLFDTSKEVKNQHVQIELTRGLLLVEGKPHAFIIAVDVWRVTREVKQAFQACIQLFGTSHVIVAFSRGEQLVDDCISIEEAARLPGHDELKAILEGVRETGRYVVVTNIPNRRQAEADLLMKKINEVSDHLRNPWSNPKLKKNCSKEEAANVCVTQ